jgi:hypothetical protein
MDLQNAGADVASARSIMQGYNKARLSSTKNYASAVYDVETAAGTFNEISSGKDLSTVAGTGQYDASQAQALAKSGGITITGDIYLNGDKSFENYLSQLRTSQGIRNQ